MKLLRSNKNKINKDKNCKNVPGLEITEAVSTRLKILVYNYS